MAVYLVMFLLAVAVWAAESSVSGAQQRMLLALTCVVFATLTGLRCEVGGDWFTYLHHFEEISNESFATAILLTDPGYAALNWLAAAWGLDIYFVNTVCAAILLWGVYRFARYPQSALTLVVAVPYLIIVVGMGYTRQGAAIGLELVALTALMRRRPLQFIGLIVLAGLFHKSAALLIPLAVLASTEKKLLVLLAVIAMSMLIGSLLLAEHYESLIENYVASGMSSEGGEIRVAMNALPALVLLIWSRRIAPDRGERRMWIWMAIFSLLCVPLQAMASTAVDRLALYFIPLQLYVFSRIQNIFVAPAAKQAVVASVVLGYGAVEFVLLSYGTNITLSWIPYKNVAPLWLHQLV